MLSRVERGRGVDLDTRGLSPASLLAVNGGGRRRGSLDQRSRLGDRRAVTGSTSTELCASIGTTTTPAPSDEPFSETMFDPDG